MSSDRYAHISPVEFEKQAIEDSINWSENQWPNQSIVLGSLLFPGDGLTSPEQTLARV
jgi:hypothetical protein